MRDGLDIHAFVVMGVRNTYEKFTIYDIIKIKGNNYRAGEKIGKKRC